MFAYIVLYFRILNFLPKADKCRNDKREEMEAIRECAEITKISFLKYTNIYSNLKSPQIII